MAFNCIPFQHDCILKNRKLWDNIWYPVMLYYITFVKSQILDIKTKNIFYFNRIFPTQKSCRSIKMIAKSSIYNCKYNTNKNTVFYRFAHFQSLALMHFYRSMYLCCHFWCCPIKCQISFHLQMLFTFMIKTFSSGVVLCQTTTTTIIISYNNNSWYCQNHRWKKNKRINSKRK